MLALYGVVRLVNSCHINIAHNNVGCSSQAYSTFAKSVWSVTPPTLRPYPLVRNKWINKPLLLIVSVICGGVMSCASCLNRRGILLLLLSLSVAATCITLYYTRVAHNTSITGHYVSADQTVRLCRRGPDISRALSTSHEPVEHEHWTPANKISRRDPSATSLRCVITCALVVVVVVLIVITVFVVVADLVIVIVVVVDVVVTIIIVVVVIVVVLIVIVVVVVVVIIMCRCCRCLWRRRCCSNWHQCIRCHHWHCNCTCCRCCRRHCCRCCGCRCRCHGCHCHCRCSYNSSRCHRFVTDIVIVVGVVVVVVAVVVAVIVVVVVVFAVVLMRPSRQMWQADRNKTRVTSRRQATQSPDVASCHVTKISKQGWAGRESCTEQLYLSLSSPQVYCMLNVWRCDSMFLK